MTPLTQAWPRPSRPRPIVIIGAGGIVRTAHLPVYRAMELPIAGIFDIRPRGRARRPRRVRRRPRVYDSLDEACSAADVVFDLAVPGDQTLGILEKLPRGAGVLMQKPMGRTSRRRGGSGPASHDRGLIAAVNLQLRFSPGMLALRDLLDAASLGHARGHRRADRHRSAVAPVDVSRARAAARAAVSLDPLSRRDPIDRRRARRRLLPRAVGIPSLPALRDTRSSIILDYGDRIRCSLVLNHTHRAGPTHRASQMMVEGTPGRRA